MSQHVRFGLVGAGAIAQAYAQAFKVCERAQLAAVADIRTEAARSLAAGFDCQSYASFEAMAAEADIDAVIVCTPPITHPEVCIHFLERQRHVLCEKPFSIDTRSAKAMVDAATRTGMTLTMSSKFRYAEDVIRAKSIVTSGVVGEIVLFENAFASRVDMTSRWNSNPQISGGGVLIDNGTHSIDIMRYFCGPLAEVQVMAGRHIQCLPVEDTAKILARSVSGIMGNIDLSWSINKELDSYIRIYGDRGTISVGWKESKYRQASSSDWTVFGKGYNKVQAFQNQLDNFAKAILGEESLSITAEDALASVEVIEAAYAAMHQSRWMTVVPGAFSGEKVTSQIQAA